MMLYKLPVPTDAVWSQQTTTLGGTPYQFTYRYNGRDDTWYWDLADQSATPILSGVPLRTNRDLIGQYPQLPLPDGLFFVRDTTGANTDPGLSGFASTHGFFFLDNS